MTEFAIGIPFRSPISFVGLGLVPSNIYPMVIDAFPYNCRKEMPSISISYEYFFLNTTGILFL